MKIAKNHAVSMNYKLKDNKGNVLDKSEGRGPLNFIQGAGNIIPGLEKALEGKTAGDSLNVVVEPKDGYGNINPDLVQTVPRSAFGDIDKIEPGMQFNGQDSQGHVQLITVTHIEGDNIAIDANHPLAGVELHFDVTIEDVRKATEDEISHGHIHEPGQSH